MLISALLLALAAGTLGDDLPPSCSRPIYCNSELLKRVQLARIFSDSKTFVDMRLLKDENTTLTEFQTLLDQTNDNPTTEQIRTFVNEHFSSATVLDEWTPPDYNPQPQFLERIRDQQLRKFGKDVNDIWPVLGRKVKAEVFENPEMFSLIPVTHGFIIPGGRFMELYYWDTYWIIEGLLISDMKDTARGVIENLIELLNIFGHIPNGGRWYYQERSQPPLLSAMVSLYMRNTKDLRFLRANIKSLEEELMYWIDTQIVTFDKDGRTHTLLRYYAPSEGPRPESYAEDYNNAHETFDTEERRTEFYTDMKSAAESGWDFSSRWFINETDGSNTGNLTNIHTKYIVPVDLNSIYANALQNMAYFQAILGHPRKAAHWAYLAKQWRSSIEQVLWHEEDGVWYDFNLMNNEHRRYFYPSNVAPLWMGTVDKRLIRKRAAKILSYLEKSKALSFEGGIPTSLLRTGEQWDFPNAWPPLVSITVNALEALGTSAAKQKAFEVAQVWVRANHQGYLREKQMFEKYDAEKVGEFGGGGEYTVQSGFGWTNGVILELLAKYGRTLTAHDGGKSDGERDGDSSTESDEYKVLPPTDRLAV